jgi:hypothetical protein
MYTSSRGQMNVQKRIEKIEIFFLYVFGIASGHAKKPA